MTRIFFVAFNSINSFVYYMILLPEKPMHAQAISHLSPQTLDMPVATDPKDLPIWNYDGSSTN